MERELSLREKLKKHSPLQQNQNLKPMVYGKFLNKPELLGVGEYKGIRWVITSVGNHPCAYVCISGTKYSCMNNEKLKDAIKCHYGVTYDGYLDHVKEAKDGRRYAGWDYGHYTDYFPGTHREDADKWTSEAVLSEIKGVIDEMKKPNYGLIVKRVYETGKTKLDFSDKKAIQGVADKLNNYLAKLEKAPKTEEISSALSYCQRLIFNLEMFLKEELEHV